ncbi:MAG: S9 family peptidase [Thermomicrobiales bacterium]
MRLPTKTAVRQKREREAPTTVEHTVAPAPLTPAELTDRLSPTDPQISLDGAFVAFTVAPMAKKGEHLESAIWMSRNGESAVQFTSGVAHDHSPRWSPDGRKLLFLSDRAERGKDKLYLLPLDGGEAKALGDLSGEFSSLEWSPDGRRIAALRKDPEPEHEKKRKEDKFDHIVVDAEPQLDRVWVVNAEDGSARCITSGKRQIRSFAWHPSGEQFAIVTTDGPDEDASCGPGDVWLIPVSGGLPKHVSRLSMVPGSPTFIEVNGESTIALYANGHRADPADSVWIVLAAGGQARNVLPDYVGTVELLTAWPDHPGCVAVRMVEGVHVKVYGLDCATGELMPLSPKGFHDDGATVSGPSLSADGERIALVWADGDKPEEVYAGPVAKPATAISSFGKNFLGRLGKVETVTWDSDGVEIEGLLTLPPGYQQGQRYPLVVEVHGGPTWQWDDHAYLDWHDWAQFLASHGYAVLQPNPRGSTGRGSEFQKLLQDDVGGGESRDLVAGALAMVERGVADRDRLGIGGWSWGGYLTARTITQTDIFKAASMGAGLSNVISDHGTDDIPSANLLYFPGLPYQHLDHYWERSPIRHVTNVKTPTLILHGDADARVHPAQGMEWYRALKSLNVPVEFVRYPREAHPIRERAHQIDLLERLIAWFDRWLKQ